MKITILLVLACLAVALSKPAGETVQIFKILKSEFDHETAGGYKYAFETENGISRDEAGEVKTIKDEEGKDQEVVVIRGSYSYPDPEGKVITVNYVADETGFHAEGEHIPKSAGRR